MTIQQIVPIVYASDSLFIVKSLFNYDYDGAGTTAVAIPKGAVVFV